VPEDAPRGANWTRKDNRPTTKPTSTWYGVTANSNGRAAKLNTLFVSENAFAGCVPSRLRDVEDTDMDGFDLEFC